MDEDEKWFRKHGFFRVLRSSRWFGSQWEQWLEPTINVQMFVSLGEWVCGIHQKLPDGSRKVIVDVSGKTPASAWRKANAALKKLPKFKKVPADMFDRLVEHYRQALHAGGMLEDFREELAEYEKIQEEY